MPPISPANFASKLANKVNDGKGSVLHNSDLPGVAGKRYKLRNAAVLIPLLRQADEWHVLYIRRSHNEKDRHSGQVAFPGGASDKADADAIDTALRETREEVGIRRDKVRVVGVLPDYETISYFRVTPVVGLLPWPCTMKLQDSEVARAFTIPLDWLLDSSNYELRERPATEHDNTRQQAGESRRPTIAYFDEYDGEILWGASARITLNFLHALRNRDLLIPGYCNPKSER